MHGGGGGREIDRGIKRLLCLMAGGMGERGWMQFRDKRRGTVIHMQQIL
jgi:hypothetical protein